MIIAIANQKGGVAKTATAQAIATGTAKTGRRSLAIDADPQSNLSYSMGGNSADMGLYELMTGAATPGQIIQHTAQGDLITASSRLALPFTGKDPGKLLATALRPIKSKYDVITIDCPPALNILLANALIAADVAIIPLTADMYALQGLYQLKQSGQCIGRVQVIVHALDELLLGFIGLGHQRSVSAVGVLNGKIQILISMVIMK